MRPMFLFLFAVVLAWPLSSLRADGPSLISNGSFKADANKDDWPDDWPNAEGASWGKDPDGTRFVRLTGLGVDKMPTLYRVIPVRPGTKAMQLKYRARAADVVVGKEKYHDARIIMHFRNRDEREVYPEPEPQRFSGSTDGWVNGDLMFMVPEGTISMQFIPAMFNCKSGSFDLTDIQLTVISPTAIEKRRIGKPINEPVPAVTDLRAGPLPSPLTVAGNKLQDTTGKAVQLQGVNIVSLETTPAGEGVLHSIRIATGEWKANAIRLPVSDTFWFGNGPGQGGKGDGYRALVDAAIQLAANNGAYAILDLRRSQPPDESCVRFWADAATRYKDHPGVLFGLFDEPGQMTWSAWRDGDAGAKSVGMQGLLDAVRRTGARNIVVVGGVDRGSDLSGIGRGYALADRAGAGGILYDMHVRPWDEDWTGKVLGLAGKYPLLLGECGVDTRPASQAPKSQAKQDPYLWAPRMLAVVQQHELHWTASAMHPEAWPRLIDTWQYEPTPFWGGFVRAALSGGRYKPEQAK